MLEDNKKEIPDFDTFPQVKPVNIYFDEVLRKLMERTDSFKGLAREIVFQSLQKIREVPKGMVLIEENTRWCDFFYILLKGRLGIYEGDIEIAEINDIQVFWEIGFLNGKRIATVQTEEKSYVVKVTREFIDELDPKVQAVFYRNIAKDLATKVVRSNGKHSNMLKNAQKKATAHVKNTEKLTDQVSCDISEHL